MLNLDIVIQNIISHYRVIWKNFRHDDLGRIFTGTLTGTKLKSTMRLTRPQPKTKWLGIFYLIKKIIKICRIICITHRFEGWLQFTFTVLMSGRVFITPPSCKPTRTPSFAGKPNGISSLLKNFSVGNKFFW